MGASLLTSFAEFETLPDITGKRELIDGEVIVRPPPALIHSELAKQIFLVLLRHFGKRHVWADHTGYRLGQGWIEPDVSVSWPDQHADENYLVGSPMIAVEILSPGEEIDRKLTLYFGEGAQEVWVVDPRRRAMTVYARTDNQVVRQPVDREFYSEAAGATFMLSEIFE